MKAIQRWLGVLLVGLAASSLIVACGDDDDASCLVDSDCFDEELCNVQEGVCALECTDDADICEGDEVCATRPSADGLICVVDDDILEGCTSDDECDTDAGETCDTETGMCVGEPGDDTCETEDDCEGDDICVDEVCVEPAGDVYFFAQLVDETIDDDACNNPSDDDPGSDIFGIELTKAVDDSKGYAYAINAEIADFDNGDPNLRDNYDDVLDGTPPNLTGECTDFADTFSLGCGGNVVVKFVDGDGTTLEIEDGDTITPMEYGKQCSDADDDDKWRLYVCDADATENELTLDVDGCGAGIEQSAGQGETEVTVSLP